MEVGGSEVQSPSKDFIEMILLTSFNLKENCDNFIFKEVCALFFSVSGKNLSFPSHFSLILPISVH